MNNSITKSVASGATWSGISQIILQSLRFAAMTVLARILFPSDFGVLAMVAIVTNIAGQLVDAGFTEALVQRKGLTENHLNTAFWTNLAIGTLLCLIVWALSPILAGFFQNQQVGEILPVSAFMFILTSLSSVHAALLKRQLRFFRSAMADIGEAVAYVGTTVPLALAGFGIWSMVWGSLVNYFALSVLRWILSGWRPSFSFDIRSLKDLWGFGVNIIGSRLVTIVVSQLDSLVIGKFLLAATLGFYSLALKIVNTPANGLWFVASRVSLPAFSLVQDQDDRLRRGVLKGEAFISIIGVPIFAGLAVTAPEVIRVVAGPKWGASVLPLQIICFTGCIKILNIGIPTMFQAKGRPDINLKIAIGDLILLVPALLIGVRFGIAGAASAVAIVTLVMWLVRHLFVHRVIDLSFKKYLFSLGPAFLSSFVMAAAVILFRYALERLYVLPDIALLPSEVLIGALVYFLVLKIIKNQDLKEMLQLTSGMFKSFSKSASVKMRPSEEK